MASDLRDILDIEKKENATLTALTNEPPKPKPKAGFKRPAGMHRELYALLYNDSKHDKPPLMPTLPSYQTAKAKLGCCKKVRAWKWMQFTNPARSDGAVLHHWRRVEDEGKDYSFAKFNKKMNVCKYTDEEYEQMLCEDSDWSKAETDHLFDLAQRFDCRWHVVYDRFDHDVCPRNAQQRTLEDMKERFYNTTNVVEQTRMVPEGEKFEGYSYNSDYERRRKLQLARLFGRTKEQVKDEAVLVSELRKIELRKKDRARKSHDFQKLLSFDPSGNESTSRKVERRKRKFPVAGHKAEMADDHRPSEMYGIKFPDYKASGNMLRSQMLKLPNSLSQKKFRIIEQKLDELKIVPNLMPSEKMIQLYNKLRNDIIYLNELKGMDSTLEVDLQFLKSKHSAMRIGGLPGEAVVAATAAAVVVVEPPATTIISTTTTLPEAEDQQPQLEDSPLKRLRNSEE